MEGEGVEIPMEPLASFDEEEPLEAPTPPPGDDEPVDDATRDVVNHLLWHKALSEEPEEADRLDEYLRLVAHSERGEHHTIQDPFHRAVALAFELVLQEHLDPWRIDLAQFSTIYLKRAREEDIDLVLSGRIILMAWTVLKLQSDAMVELADRLANPPQPEPVAEFLDWGDIGDWNYDDEDLEYTRRVTHSPQAPLDEKVRRQGDSRKVTLMELVDAFEEVRREAEERQRMKSERERTRALLRQQADDSVTGMMHAEDPEAEQKSLWERILSLNGNAIPLRELHEPQIDSFVTTFNSVLFLASDRKVRLWQEDFPYGSILVKNREHVSAEEDAAEEAELVTMPAGGDETPARRTRRRIKEEDTE
jgi:segregation and condensation protein A